jgi:hypothetical protein
MLPSGLRYLGSWTGDNDKLDPASSWDGHHGNAVRFCNDHAAIAANTRTPAAATSSPLSAHSPRRAGKTGRSCLDPRALQRRPPGSIRYKGFRYQPRAAGLLVPASECPLINVRTLYV